MSFSWNKKSVLALAVSVAFIVPSATGAFGATAGGTQPTPEPTSTTTPAPKQTGLVPNPMAKPDYASATSGAKAVHENIHANDSSFDASKDILIDPKTGAKSAPMVGKKTQLTTADGTATLIQTGPNSTRYEFVPKTKTVEGVVSRYFSTDSAAATSFADVHVTYTPSATPAPTSGVVPNAVANDDEAIGTFGETAKVTDIFANDVATPNSVWLPNETTVFDKANPFNKVVLTEDVTTINTAEGVVTLTVGENNEVSAELDSDGKEAQAKLSYLPMDSNDARGFADINLVNITAETPPELNEPPVEETPAPELNEPPVDPNTPVTTPEAPAPELNEPPVDANTPVEESPETPEIPVTTPNVPESVSSEIPVLTTETATSTTETNVVTPQSKLPSVAGEEDEMAVTPGHAVASEAPSTNEGGFTIGGYILAVLTAIGAGIFGFTGRKVA